MTYARTVPMPAHGVNAGDYGLVARDATAAEALDRASSDAQLLAAPALGDLPLIVLAAGQSMEQIPYWPEAQRRLPALSTNGRLIVVEGSGHAIHWEQPARVIDAVQQVIEQSRGN